MSSAPDPVSSLVEESARVRQAVHALIDQMRRDREAWIGRLTELPRRPRLTREQRNAFRRYLSRQRH